MFFFFLLVGLLVDWLEFIWVDVFELKVLVVVELMVDDLMFEKVLYVFDVFFLLFWLRGLGGWIVIDCGEEWEGS